MATDITVPTLGESVKEATVARWFKKVGERVEMDVKVGDTVLFAKYAGTEFKHEDEELLILSEKDIVAIIED